MSVIGEFSIPSSSFALDEALTEHPSVVVEAERMATHSTMQVMPFLWGSGCDADEFRDALRADPSIESADVSEDTGDGVLYVVVWEQAFRDLIDAVVDHHGAMVEATGADGTWHLTLRFAEEHHVGEFQDHFREAGRNFEVVRLYQPTAPRQREYDLTPEQRDALVTAFSGGYFDVPRRSSTSDIAAALGISANAVSARIRRGTASLVDSTLVIDGGGDRDDEDER
ncbi:helix-turn-helix domain-containing protein [Halobacteria archaeon HArc-gm2]|nr:helix-turn-helix domain-containing protein [Halobacteria archaeon HArc-gm2]